jgi:hypothetical protein
MRTIPVIALVISGSLASSAIAAPQAPTPPAKGSLEDKLQGQYTLTQPTADNTDIVTAGAVLVLQKTGLVAGAVSSKVIIQDTYKDGILKGGKSAAVQKFRGLGLPGVPGAGVADTPTRDFVKGEKVYVTNISRKDTGLVFDLISCDAFDNVRYRASLRFDYAKGALDAATFEQVQAMVSQVFAIAPADDSSAAAQAPAGQGAQQGAAQAQGAAQQADAPPAAIPPPPPPPDEPVAPPKTVALGQTVDTVVANFGQPDKIVKLAGTKQVYYYKDFKVTFVGGKVTDVQ